jgi:hypothetical protein
MGTIIQIQVRRDTAADWLAADPVLAEGEQGLETDTQRIKYGDGVTAWSSLAYFSTDKHRQELRVHTRHCISNMERCTQSWKVSFTCDH